MKKNLRKNNGFAGIDISISMIIILIFIPTIFGIVYNIGKINAEVKPSFNAVKNEDVYILIPLTRKDRE